MGRIKSLLNKHEFFLKKAKLIIGNGIDLHCGFKTSYSIISILTMIGLEAAL